MHGNVEELDGKVEKACPSQLMQERNQLLVQPAVLLQEGVSMALLARLQEDKIYPLPRCDVYSKIRRISTGNGQITGLESWSCFQK